MRVALYARVSRADKDQNPEGQLLKLRGYALRLEWEVYGEFQDYVSGAAPIKPAMEKMMSEGRARHYDAVLVVRLDRLARSTKQLLTMLEELDRCGVALICTDQQIDKKKPGWKTTFHHSGGGCGARARPDKGKDEGWPSEGEGTRKETWATSESREHG